MLEMLITLAFAIVHPLVLLVYRNLQFNQITINHGIHQSASICPHMLYPGTPLHIHMHESSQNSEQWAKAETSEVLS